MNVFFRLLGPALDYNSLFQVVISLGMEAMHTGDPVDYARYYQQQSDVCMLRLFDSFLEVSIVRHY